MTSEVTAEIIEAIVLECPYCDSENIKLPETPMNIGVRGTCRCSVCNRKVLYIIDEEF